MPDPWTTIEDRYGEGQIVEGEVTRTVDFGAFVKLEDGVEGLVHISQLADHRVENASDVVQPGQQVKVKVINLDPNARRIGLSIKAANPKPPKPKREPLEAATDDVHRSGSRRLSPSATWSKG